MVMPCRSVIGDIIIELIAHDKLVKVLQEESKVFPMRDIYNAALVVVKFVATRLKLMNTPHSFNDSFVRICVSSVSGFTYRIVS
jgi:hypothetical protein